MVEGEYRERIEWGRYIPFFAMIMVCYGCRVWTVYNTIAMRRRLLMMLERYGAKARSLFAGLCAPWIGDLREWTVSRGLVGEF